jgi:hypothetical protein
MSIVIDIRFVVSNTTMLLSLKKVEMMDSHLIRAMAIWVPNRKHDNRTCLPWDASRDVIRGNRTPARSLRLDSS